MIKTVKDFIKTHSSVHRPDGRKNILLFSSPRSGSTWLLEILMMEKGYKWLNEPFNIRKTHEKKYSGISSWVELYNKSSKEKIGKYLETLAKTNIKDAGYRYPAPFRPFWRPVTHGTIFKILHACEADIDELKTRLNAEVIFLIRHPIPVSLSREELPRLEAYIASDYAENFTPAQIEFSKKVIEHGTMFEKAILDWCLQNVVPLKQMQNDWMLVTYEEMVLNPVDVIDRICNKLNFTAKDKMIERVNIASGSSQKSKEETQKIIFDPEKLKENKKWLLEKWRNKVSEADIRAAQDILDVFDIKLYSANNILPLATTNK